MKYDVYFYIKNDSFYYSFQQDNNFENYKLIESIDNLITINTSIESLEKVFFREIQHNIIQKFLKRLKVLVLLDKNHSSISKIEVVKLFSKFKRIEEIRIYDYIIENNSKIDSKLLGFDNV